MSFNKFKFYSKFFSVYIKHTCTLLCQRIQAIGHKWTYQEVSSPKNVVVLGGSFGGAILTRRLADSLPTGYRVVMIEKNSHFNFLFNFPRYSVIKGHEQRAFVPYDRIAQNAPKGIFQHVHDVATQLRDGEVELKSGDKIKFEYLAIATGASQPPPARLLSTEKEKNCAELRELQNLISSAATIAIVGGGAVGVQLSGDIRSQYPDKEVTLIHSRDQLLPSFGKNLHDYAVKMLEKLGVKVILGERPQLDIASGYGNHSTIQFKDGRSEKFDLIIPCTGQRPNSAIITSLAPDSISKTGRILVKPTLQIARSSNSTGDLSRIFAFGDVAETGGPKMARAGMMQAEVVRENIINLIKKKQSLKEYVPISIEGAIKLSLGKADLVMYMKNDDGTDMMLPVKNEDEDLGVEKVWKMMNAQPDF